MALHARQMAIAAGAQDAQVGQVVEQMLATGTISLDEARRLVAAGDGTVDKESNA